MCKKSAVAEFKPFCSRLCKDKDMLNWLNGSYLIPTPITNEQDENGAFKEIEE